VRAIYNFVADTTNPSLTTLDAGQLFHKKFAVRATISALGGTVFEFTLQQLVSEVK
jgi:hypothetical protein